MENQGGSRLVRDTSVSANADFGRYNAIAGKPAPTLRHLARLALQGCFKAGSGVCIIPITVSGIFYVATRLYPGNRYPASRLDRSIPRVRADVQAPVLPAANCCRVCGVQRGSG